MNNNFENTTITGELNRPQLTTEHNNYLKKIQLFTTSRLFSLTTSMVCINLHGHHIITCILNYVCTNQLNIFGGGLYSLSAFLVKIYVYV